MLLWNEVVLRSNAGLPSERRRYMAGRRPLLALHLKQVFTIRTPWDCVVIPEQTSTPQLGQEQLDNVFEGVGKEGICLGGGVKVSSGREPLVGGGEALPG